MPEVVAGRKLSEGFLPGIPAILVIEDHEILRAGLRSMLTAMGITDIDVLEAGTLAQGVASYQQAHERIALVVLDLNLPDSKGLSALQKFMQLDPRARIVVLSGSVDDAIAEEARTLGAYRFLHKASDVAELGRLVAEVVAARREREHIASASGPDASPPITPQSAKRMRLSPRELQILDLLLQGGSNQDIADATGLRIGTVKNYISGLLVVFGVPSRSKLISLFR